MLFSFIRFFQQRLQKYRRLHAFSIPLPHIKQVQTILCARHPHIKQPTLFFKICLHRRFPMRNRPFIDIYQKDLLKFQSFRTVERRQRDCIRIPLLFPRCSSSRSLYAVRCSYHASDRLKRSAAILNLIQNVRQLFRFHPTRLRIFLKVFLIIQTAVIECN